MRARSPVFPKNPVPYDFKNEISNVWGNPNWPKDHIIKIKKWGNGQQNSGPVGYKAKASYRLRRALADMARARKGH